MCTRNCSDFSVFVTRKVETIHIEFVDRISAYFDDDKPLSTADRKTFER